MGYCGFVLFDFIYLFIYLLCVCVGGYADTYAEKGQFYVIQVNNIYVLHFIEFCALHFIEFHHPHFTECFVTYFTGFYIVILKRRFYLTMHFFYHMLRVCFNTWTERGGHSTPKVNTEMDYLHKSLGKVCRENNLIAAHSSWRIQLPCLADFA